MTQKEYIEQVRPFLRLLIGTYLTPYFLKIVDGPTADRMRSAYQGAEVLISEFEKDFKFEDRP